MLGLDKTLLGRAIEKANGAYGKDIERDLLRAVEALKKRPGRLDDRMRELQMLTKQRGIESPTLAVLWKRISALSPKTKAAKPRAKK